METHIVHGDLIAVTEGIVIPQFFHHIGILAQRIQIILKQLFFGDKFSGFHVVQCPDLLSQRQSVVPADVFVDIDHDLALTFQLPDLQIQIVGHQRKGAGDHQTGCDDQHGRQTGKAVHEHRGQALPHIVGKAGLAVALISAFLAHACTSSSDVSPKWSRSSMLKSSR